MAARLRLTRIGSKKRPFYRLVVLDRRRARNGKYIENLGYYNPIENPPVVQLKEDQILKWLSVGVEVTDTVKGLLRREGILQKWHQIKTGVPLEPEETLEEELSLEEMGAFEAEEEEAIEVGEEILEEAEEVEEAEAAEEEPKKE